MFYLHLLLNLAPGDHECVALISTLLISNVLQDEVHNHSRLHGTLLQKDWLQVRARQQANSAQVLECFKDGRVRLFVSRETRAASPRAVSSWDRGALQTVGPAELGP